MEKERGKNMNIKSNGKVLVLAKNSRESSDGKQKYYNLAILIDGEAGNISCSEDAYNKAVLNTLNGVIYVYNEKYQTFRIVDIVPESSILDYTQQNASSDKPDAKPDPKADNPAKPK